MEEKEQICFQIISEAGMARSCFFESIQQVRKEQTKEALSAIESGKSHYHKAHIAHRQLVQQEAQGDKVWMSLLLSHAEDLLMSADIMSELAKEFNLLYEEVNGLKQMIDQHISSLNTKE